jgi:F-type H+-transporting ATPase subunit b
MGDIEIFGIPISIGTMIYQAILFTVLIFILKNKLLGKLVDAMENRRESIDNQLKLADTYKKEAEDLLIKQREDSLRALHESRDLLANAHEEASEIIMEARKDAHTTRTQAFEERRARKERGAS